MAQIVIIDYGMGNLGSVRRAFEECGADVAVANEPTSLFDAAGIVLPGVGAFVDGMKNLKDRGWIEVLTHHVQSNKIPVLGICLGMQLLAERSFEGGETAGLGWISGEVIRLQPTELNERIPHVGWNEVYQNQNHALIESVKEGTDFYFVHSYHFVPSVESAILLKTPYCGQFVSAVVQDNIMGVQFHPEKSSKPGFQIIRNFLNLC